MVLEKTLESPLDSKEIQLVNPKGNQSWIFIGRTEVEAENPILWPPDGKNWLIGKDFDAEKDWRQEEKGMTEDGWMASPTWWTWVWASSESWWWTGKPHVLQSMGSQRVGHDWVTELDWTEVGYSSHQESESEVGGVRRSLTRRTFQFIRGRSVLCVETWILPSWEPAWPGGSEGALPVKTGHLSRGDQTWMY